MSRYPLVRAIGPQSRSLYRTVDLDQYRDLHALEKELASSELESLKSVVSYVLRYFRESDVFVALPDSNLCPQNPGSLPRETYVDHGRVGLTLTKKKGRPNRNDKTRKTKAAMGNLESWLEMTESLVERPPAIAAGTALPVAADNTSEYKLIKARLLDAIDLQGSEGRSTVVNANQLVLQRLLDVRELVPEEDTSSGGPPNAGISRVEEAIEDLGKGRNRGILNLLEGSGKR